MTIFDRYVLRQFLQIFVICFLSLAGLYVVIDAFQHLDSFTDFADQHGGLVKVTSQYYAYQSFDLFDRTSGLLAMIAAMFTVTWLQRHQELTAVMAAGISKFRAVRPVVLAAISVSILAAMNREMVIPLVRDELARDTKDLGGTQYRDMEARFDGQTDILIGGDKTVAKEMRIVNPTLVLPNALAKYGRHIKAENAYHLPASSEHPAGYLLDHVTQPNRIDKLRSLRLGERAIVVTSREADWLEPGQAFVVSKMPFELLANGSRWRRFASLRELIRELNEPSTEQGADLKVAVHTRLLQPVTDSTMLMLGLPLMFSRRYSNVFVAIGICLLAGVSFSIVTLACQSLGSMNLLRPTLAAWLPLMIFVPVAVALGHAFRT